MASDEPVSEWSDDQTTTVAEILIAVLELGVGLLDYTVIYVLK